MPPSPGEMTSAAQYKQQIEDEEAGLLDTEQEEEEEECILAQ